MKAMVVSQYGGPEVLEYKDFPDPSPGPDEVLVRVAATSVNPIDMKRRSGEAKAFLPINFPGILGVDVSGTVVLCGENVKSFSAGDQVFGIADRTYAELCVVNAKALVKIPPKLDLVDAAALPLVTTTGYQLISKGAPVKSGQSVLVTGALGNVGRCAVYTARSRGAMVIAGVRKKQLGQASESGAERAVAVDDPDAIAKLEALDAVADAVDGATAELLIGKVKAGGMFGSVLGPPKNSGQFPSVKVVSVYAQPDPDALLELANAVIKGELVIPIATKMPLREAAQAHALAAKGGKGKVLLLP